MNFRKLYYGSKLKPGEIYITKEMPEEQLYDQSDVLRMAREDEDAEMADKIKQFGKRFFASTRFQAELADALLRSQKYLTLVKLIEKRVYCAEVLAAEAESLYLMDLATDLSALI